MRCDFGKEGHGLEFEFWGDGQGHRVGIDDDLAQLEWDDVSRVLTIRFTHGSERAAEQLFWRLLEIVPALRNDRR